jgi:seryl-tRNA synthetase
LRKVGKTQKFDFKVRDHVELGEMLDIIDLERAGKVSGSRFVYLKNEGAILQFALMRWAMDILVNKGFCPMLPPVMVKGEIMDAMGYLQHGGNDETYFFEKDDLYLIGTSEQSGLPYHRDEILDQAELPKRYVCYSTCFRREAGSYGKDVKGMIRNHQFDKLEMLSVTTPEESQKEHEMFLAIEEELMQALGLPYQVVVLCTGDLGDPAAKTYDIETWFPSQDKYRETHSTSTTTDFQARRLNMRYKTKEGKNIYCHTLNGTAFARRSLIAILENFQQEDGSVEIPKLLRPYMNKMKKIEPKK